MPITYTLLTHYGDITHSREFISRQEAIKTAKEQYDNGALEVRVYHYEGQNCRDDFWLEREEENELTREGGQFGMGA